MSRPVILLGYGFAGEAILPVLTAAGLKVSVTSRKPEKLSLHNTPVFAFDFHNPETWENLPAGSDLIWTFPADRPTHLIQFLDWCHSQDLTCRVVLGTTSAFLSDAGPVDENSPLKPEDPRVVCERLLMDSGAIWLLCSGLWGGARHPADWLRRGLIQNGNKLLNLIHREDVAAVVLHVLQSGIRRDLYCLSDGNSYLWKELLIRFRESGFPVPETLPEGPHSGKWILNNRVRQMMGAGFSFRTL